MNKNKPELQYLSPAEAAAMLGVGRRTIYEWLRSGKLPSIRFGSTWRIPRKALEATSK